MKRTTPMQRHIGAKVRYYRELRGWTQEALAAKLQTGGWDLSRTAVGQIEIGYRTTSIYEIDGFAQVLGVDYNALFAKEK